MSRVNVEFAIFDNQTTNGTINETQQNATVVRSWFTIKGKELVYKKPVQKKYLLKVATDKITYLPGDLVNYNITVYNASSKARVVEDVYVNFQVTDDRSQQGLTQQDRQPSLAARLFLENEFNTISFDQSEVMSVLDSNISTDAKIEALLFS